MHFKKQYFFDLNKITTINLVFKGDGKCKLLLSVEQITET